MSDIEKLRAEIVGDPLERGYAAMTDAEAAADLNAAVIAVYVEVPLVDVLRELIMLSDGTGRFAWDAVLTAAADSQHPAQDLARRLKFLFDGGLPINWGGASANTLMNFAVAAGFFTAEQAQILKDTGRRMVSRAAQLGLDLPVRVGHVTEARQ